MVCSLPAFVGKFWLGSTVLLTLGLVSLVAAAWLGPRSTLTTHATPVLAAPGLRPGQPDGCHGTAAAWGSEEPYENEFIVHPDGEGWHLDRARFDALLAARAKARGAQLWAETAFLDSERQDDGWQLTLRQRGHSWIIHARFVVDATGRRRLVVVLGTVSTKEASRLS